MNRHNGYGSRNPRKAHVSNTTREDLDDLFSAQPDTPEYREELQTRLSQITREEIDAYMELQRNQLDLNRQRIEEEMKSKRSERYVNMSMAGCLAAFIGSTFFMVARNCMNSDKGKKFEL